MFSVCLALDTIMGLLERQRAENQNMLHEMRQGEFYIHQSIQAPFEG